MEITIEQQTSMGLPQTMRQPSALRLLVVVQMWECFSFYGMRALLVLYMISQLGFSDLRAIGIYAVYSGLVDLGSVIGGIIADKILGLRRAICIGGWLIAAGHITMAFEVGNVSLFIGLALIVIGTSLFSTNISALLGLFYSKEDSRREEGFTLFYMSINIGALLASIICGAVGEYYGWHYGFGMAAIGMIIGNVAMLAFSNHLEGKGLPPMQVSRKLHCMMPGLLGLAICAVAGVISYGSEVLHYLPLICVGCVGYVAWKLIASNAVPISQLMRLLILLGALALFYAAEEQIGSTLMILNERYAAKTLAGIETPASFLLGINPAVIILCGTLVNRICRRFSLQNSASSRKLVIAFSAAAAAFAGIALACAFPNQNGEVSLFYLAFGVIIISAAELLVGPTVYSYCSEIAPEEQQGAVMGLVPIGFSLASILGGCLSSLMVADETAVTSLPLFTIGYGIIAAILGVAALGLPLIYQLSFKRATV